MKRAVFSTLLVGLALASCAQDKSDGGGSQAPQATKANAGPAATPPKAPAVYKVEFATTKGDFIVEVTRAWAPLGADRFHEIVASGFYQDTALFRVIENFVAQFGLHADPAVTAKWKDATIKDDPVLQANERGMVTFATRGPNTRTTQLFINMQHNKPLDSMGFAPFAKVIKGLDVIDRIHRTGEAASQQKITNEGNAYLKKNFPKMDYIKSAKFVN